MFDRVCRVVVCILPLSYASCDEGDASETDRIEDILTLDGDRAAGAGLFESSCANMACHGAGGVSGAAGVPLDEVVPLRTDTRLLEIMLLGEDSMPGQAFDDQEAADALAYLRHAFE